LFDVITLADEKFDSVSEDDWKHRCDHVQIIVDLYMNNEGQDIVIHLGGADDCRSGIGSSTD
jgi:hypothetical protein